MRGIAASLAKVALITLVVACMAAVPGTWAGGYDYLFTDTMVNGTGFSDENPTIVADTECYTYGCMDALFCVNNEAMCAMYPHTTKKDILDAVKLYYTNNPGNRDRPVLQVLMAGCK